VSETIQKSKRRAAETLSELRKGEWTNTEIQKKSCRNLKWPTEGWVNKHRNPKEELQKPWVIYGRVSKQTQKSKRRAAETLSDLRKGEWTNKEIQKKSCRNLKWPTEGWVKKHRNPKEELQKPWVTYGRVSEQTQKSKRRAAETLSDLEWPTEGWAVSVPHMILAEILWEIVNVQ
jgi:hypothetical protein